MRDNIINIIAQVCEVDVGKLENVDLIEEEMLDSLSFVNLIAKLEDEFDIEIQPTQIEYSVWSDINLIVKMVEEKIKENQ